MEKMTKYVVEARFGNRDFSTVTREGYSAAMSIARQKIREGGTNVVILGFNSREECVLENTISEDSRI